MCSLCTYANLKVYPINYIYLISFLDRVTTNTCDDNVQKYMNLDLYGLYIKCLVG